MESPISVDNNGNCTCFEYGIFCGLYEKVWDWMKKTTEKCVENALIWHDFHL